MFDVRYLSAVVYCFLRVGYVLRVVCCSLCGVRCLLFIVRALCVAWCSVFGAACLLYDAC